MPSHLEYFLMESVLIKRKQKLELKFNKYDMSNKIPAAVILLFTAYFHERFPTLIDLTFRFTSHSQTPIVIQKLFAMFQFIFTYSHSSSNVH